jgi:hypothetical protein
MRHLTVIKERHISEQSGHEFVFHAGRQLDAAVAGEDLELAVSDDPPDREVFPGCPCPEKERGLGKRPPKPPGLLLDGRIELPGGGVSRVQLAFYTIRYLSVLFGKT